MTGGHPCGRHLTGWMQRGTSAGAVAFRVNLPAGRSGRFFRSHLIEQLRSGLTDTDLSRSGDRLGSRPDQLDAAWHSAGRLHSA